ncbi:hypothetical protein UUR12_A0132 [Ureaplasma urealyticum serovar 12 str. ATCC 33696]|nr:hypothetical protein UUR12_A0132 [Ureaplasma urealyticum serovar 12 str. ATCC 33696]EDY74878.1 hypothetical protein UUR4_0092 [Ureaplasma urealyticum serovar 4 str. ATCC 27816]
MHFNNNCFFYKSQYYQAKIKLESLLLTKQNNDQNLIK